jgi:phenylpropionate dioxygenase-like ring-hydroxylating dioxygenase large terminal subunit
VGVPFHQDAYGGEEGLAREGTTLLSPARVGTYDGLIFASLDPDAPALEDYLGGMRFFLDFYLRQSEAGAEVRGPQRWIVEANWKTAADNFAGDSYHTPHTHKSIVDIGLFEAPKASKRKQGVNYFADVGGGTSYKLPTSGFEQGLACVGYPQEMIERMASGWSPAQRRLVAEHGFMISAASALPNLAFVHNWPRVDATGRIAPFISIRLWQPLSTSRTEILSWFAVDKLAPERFKADSYKAYVMCFGSSGMFEQDDVENWTSITRVAHGQMARRLKLNNRMGLDQEGRPIRQPVEDWPAPGFGYRGFGEFNQRAWWNLYSDYMSADPARPRAEKPMAMIG